MSLTLWIAIGATVTVVGTVWQVITSARTGLDSMRHFLAAQNSIVQREVGEAKNRFSRLRVVKRRRASQAVLAKAANLLDADELRLSQAYNRQAWGWGLVTLGAVIGAIAAWVDVAA
ncbi:hypothetical protein HD599_002055 [Conyzicola lurida]|uniref:Uncharacterized protein n=1 Tax=Conyzicola lurida TaxID=1172621 RepID=A0A841AP48_9MICO|nr:hypothetical protein [Conyzicola lurida]MBB5843732.1 hypothetical protein [Conyzicola lurida]